jgi:hypothetical protein
MSDSRPLAFEIYMEEADPSRHDVLETDADVFSKFEQTRTLASAFTEKDGPTAWVRSEAFLQECEQRNHYYERFAKRDAGEALKQFSAAGGAGGTGDAGGNGNNNWVWATPSDPDPDRLEKNYGTGLRTAISENGRVEYTFDSAGSLIAARVIESEER